ncbi:MAG: phage tail protein [Firmicutes bacterium]|nr:phage tail protein [Bacillota bacterium]
MSDKSINVVITPAARKKLVYARAGAISLPRIVGMAFGDGGVDADGNIIAPKEGQKALAHELYRKPVDGYSFPEDTVCRYACTLTEQELANEEISEIGFYDEDGDILAIKAFKRKGKDDDFAQTFVLDDIF